MYFLVFHGKERWKEAAHGHDAHHDDHADEHHHGLGPNDNPHETPWVVTLPLVMLAIPSVIIGFLAVEPMLFGDFFKEAIFNSHDVMDGLREEFKSPASMGIGAFASLPFWLALAGVVVSWFFYMKRPDIPAAIKQKFSFIYKLMENKYYMDDLYIEGFAGAGLDLGKVFWKLGDTVLIDGLVVNGAAKLVGFVSRIVRRLQTGYIYHYAFAMIFGAMLLLTWWVIRVIDPQLFGNGWLN
jgi:NADH-quinone oxidoreductase subunit L